MDLLTLPNVKLMSTSSRFRFKSKTGTYGIEAKLYPLVANLATCSLLGNMQVDAE